MASDAFFEKTSCESPDSLHAVNRSFGRFDETYGYEVASADLSFEVKRWVRLLAAFVGLGTILAEANLGL